MNFNAPWNVDMSVDIASGEPLTTFNFMIHAQRGMFGVSLLLGTYYCWRISSHQLMHFNFRLIMASTAVYAITFTGSRILMYLLLSTTQNFKDRTFPNVVCIFLGTVHSLSIMALISSMLMVGFERYLATVYVYGYESKKRIIGYLLSGLVLFFGIISATIMNFTHLYRFFDIETTYQTCIPVELFPEQAIGSFFLGISGCLLSAFWQLYLYRRNKNASKNKANLDSLTARFQQVENMNTTRLICPIMLVYMFMCLLGVAMSRTRFELMKDGNLAQAKVVMQAGYMLIDSCCIFCMFFVLLFHPGLRYHVKRDFLGLVGIKSKDLEARSRRHVGGVIDPVDIHFQQLAKFWQ